MFRWLLTVLGAKWPLNRLEIENREIGSVPCQFSPAFACSSISQLCSSESNNMSSWRSTAVLYEHGYQNGAPCIGCYVFIWRFIHEPFARYCWFLIFASSNFSLTKEKISIQIPVSDTPGERTVVAQIRWHICAYFSLKL